MPGARNLQFKVWIMRSASHRFRCREFVSVDNPWHQIRSKLHYKVCSILSESTNIWTDLCLNTFMKIPCFISEFTQLYRNIFVISSTCWYTIWINTWIYFIYTCISSVIISMIRKIKINKTIGSNQTHPGTSWNID